VLDPRDLKFHGLVVDGGWRPSDDPFDWRNRVGFARWGLAELVLMVGGMCTLALILAWLWWPASLVPLALAVFVACFFRDPPRTVPAGPGIVVSPADGTVTEVLELDHDDFIGGPAVRVSIFLSIFNVHLNRTPVRCRVIRLRYHPGRFINAMDPRSAEVNENMWIGLEEEDPPHRRLVLRQVSGAIARRIVCTLRPGEVLERGQKFGMIKLGSRTELILAKEPGLAIEVQPGRKLRAGTTIVARFSLPGTDK
jgi:phosphatidylserine decarboxylase